METQRNPSLLDWVVILNALVAFILGIIGEELGNWLQMSLPVLVMIAVPLLLINSVLSYVTNHNRTDPSVKSIFSFIPTTILGIFPIGVAMGFIVGLLTIPIVGSSVSDIGILTFDFFGVLFGLGACLLFATIIDGPLASGLAAGYGISYPAGAVLIQPFISVYYSPLYYLAYAVGFLALARILYVAEPRFSMIRRSITQSRLPKG